MRTELGLDTWRPRVQGAQLKALQGARLPEFEHEFLALRRVLDSAADCLLPESSPEALLQDFRATVAKIQTWWKSRNKMRPDGEGQLPGRAGVWGGKTAAAAEAAMDASCCEVSAGQWTSCATAAHHTFFYESRPGRQVQACRRVGAGQHANGGDASWSLLYGFCLAAHAKHVKAHHACMLLLRLLLAGTLKRPNGPTPAMYQQAAKRRGGCAQPTRCRLTVPQHSKALQLRPASHGSWCEQAVSTRLSWQPMWCEQQLQRRRTCMSLQDVC